VFQAAERAAKTAKEEDPTDDGNVGDEMGATLREMLGELRGIKKVLKEQKQAD
jgi:hypothetical protein